MTRKISLTYFDFGGRAESIRLTFLLGKVEFEDIRISREEWGQLKQSGNAKFGQLPLLEVDGKQFAQSRAILKYAGKLSGNLYPQNYLEQLVVDEGVDLVEEIFQKLAHAVFGIQDEEKRTEFVQKQLVGEILPRLFGYYDKQIQKSQGQQFYGDKLSVADIYLFAVTTVMYSGAIPNFKYDLGQHKRVNELVEKIKTFPEIKSYYANKQH